LAPVKFNNLFIHILTELKKNSETLFKFYIFSTFFFYYQYLFFIHSNKYLENNVLKKFYFFFSLENGGYELSIIEQMPEEEHPEHGKYFFANITRKRADQDALLLRNRINLLKAEENKAIKKIEETKDKIKEITCNRTRNSDHLQTKQTRQESENQRVLRLREQNVKMREKLKNRVKSSKTKINAERAENSSIIRNERLIMEDTILDYRHEEMEANKMLRRLVRTQKTVTRSRHDKNLEIKKLDARLNFEAKVERERLMFEKRESEIKSMEMEEVALIQRLQNTQRRQRATYEELEQVIQESEAIRQHMNSIPDNSAQNGQKTLTNAAGNLLKGSAGVRPISNSGVLSTPKSNRSSQKGGKETLPGSPKSPKAAEWEGKDALTAEIDKQKQKHDAKVLAAESAKIEAMEKPKALPPSNTAANTGKNILNAAPSPPVGKVYTTVDGLSFKVAPVQPQAEELELASVLNNMDLPT